MANYAWVKLARNGLVVIPAAFREALGLEEGDDLQIEMRGDELRIMTKPTVLRQVQEDVRRYIPEGRSLVGELLAERRNEARPEDMESGHRPGKPATHTSDGRDTP